MRARIPPPIAPAITPANKRFANSPSNDLSMSRTARADITARAYDTVDAAAKMAAPCVLSFPLMYKYVATVRPKIRPGTIWKLRPKP